MSLFNFIKSYLEENPDLMLVNDFTKPINYESLYTKNRDEVNFIFNVSKKDSR